MARKKSAKTAAKELEKEGYSQADIATELNVAGYRTARGLEFNAMSVSRLLSGRVKRAKTPAEAAGANTHAKTRRSGATSAKRDLVDAVLAVTETKMDKRSKRRILEALL